jgi:hypothetical protein
MVTRKSRMRSSRHESLFSRLEFQVRLHIRYLVARVTFLYLSRIANDIISEEKNRYFPTSHYALLTD